MKQIPERFLDNMYNYVPFLKLKVNEVGALSVLDDDLKKVIVPFFDLPKQKDGATPADFSEMTSKAARSAAKNLKGIKAFFLDNFDIDDTIRIGGVDSYAFVIEEFKNLEFIPIVGLDRTEERNNIVFQKKKEGVIKSNVLGIRLLYEDFVSYELVEDDIANIIAASNGYFASLVFVLDNRVCIDADIGEAAGKISKFVTKLNQDFQPDSIVITGSSIPASIADILAVESDGIYERKEVEIYRAVVSHVHAKNLVLGDYTIVSPLYSEFKIPPQAMRNVTAPKIFLCVR